MEIMKLAAEYCKLHNLAPETTHTYLECARSIGNPRLSEITASWLEQSASRTRSAFTWNARLARLRALTRYAISLGLANLDHPVFSAKRRTAVLPERRAIGDDDYERACRAVDSLEQVRDGVYKPAWFWRALMSFLYFTGVRRKLLCALTWGDIDFGAKMFLLRPEVSKTRRGAKLPLHPELVEILKQYRALLQHINGHLPSREQQLFSPRHAKAGIEAELLPYRVSSFFHVVSSRLEFKLSAHRLRHNFATRLSRHAKTLQELQTVQQLMTHERIDTTMGYLHPTSEDKLTLLDVPVAGISGHTGPNNGVKIDVYFV